MRRTSWSADAPARASSEAGPGARVYLVVLAADDDPAAVACDEDSVKLYPLPVAKFDPSRAVIGREALARVARALDQTAEISAALPAKGRFSTLTPRERDVLALILEGRSNKVIAAELEISMRTVENHRASIMRKSGCKSLPALVKLALLSEASDPVSPASPSRLGAAAAAPSSLA